MKWVVLIYKQVKKEHRISSQIHRLILNPAAQTKELSLPFQYFQGGLYCEQV